MIGGVCGVEREMSCKENPCGACDIGVYSELACLNEKARKFGALNFNDRCKNMPMCKNENHICWGAKHYHEMITEIDKFGENK